MRTRMSRDAFRCYVCVADLWSRITYQEKVKDPILKIIDWAKCIPAFLFQAKVGNYSIKLIDVNALSCHKYPGLTPNNSKWFF